MLFFYLFFPFRFLEEFVFPNQIEVVVFSVYASSLLIGLKLLFSPKNTLKINDIDIILGVYCLFTLVRYFADYRILNIECLLQDFSLIGLYLFFRNNNLSALFFIIPVAVIVQLLYGIAKQTGYFMPGYGLKDISGIFYNTGIFAGFVSIAIVIILSFLLFKPLNTRCSIQKNTVRLIQQLIISISSSVLILQLVASNSRTAWLSCISASLYLLNARYHFFNKKNYSTRSTPLLIIVLLFAVLAVFSLKLYQYKPDSANGRLLIWEITSEMIKDNPVLGHGLNGFQRNYMEYQGHYFETHLKHPFRYLADDNIFAFNEFLRIWTEQGIPSVLLVIFLIYLLICNKCYTGNVQSSLWQKYVAKAVLIAIIVFGMFSYPTEVFQFKVIIVFCIALLSTDRKKVKPKNYSILTKLLQLKPYLLPSCLLLASAIILPLNYKYTNACKKWDLALKSISSVNYNVKLKELASVYPYLTNNNVFLSSYGKALLRFGQPARAADALERANIFCPLASNYMALGKCYKAQGNFSNAEQAWRKAQNMIPSKFSPSYEITKMYYENGEITEAKAMAKTLLAKKIKHQTPEIEQIINELSKIKGD